MLAEVPLTGLPFLGCEPVESAVERVMEEMMERLTPIQRRRLQKRLAEGGDEGEGQGVA
jgi:hypothetical protein